MCLVTVEQFNASATLAARSAASMIALALSFVLTPTTAGAVVDETKKLADGTLIHVTGQQSEMKRQILVTLPNGQQTALILTTNDRGGGYDLESGSVLGAPMSPSMLASMAGQLSSDGVQILYNQKNGDQKYFPPPRTSEGITGIPGLVKDKPISGRPRWHDKKGNIYEWDFQHGTLEKFDKTGKSTLENLILAQGSKLIRRCEDGIPERAKHGNCICY